MSSLSANPTPAAKSGESQLDKPEHFNFGECWQQNTFMLANYIISQYLNELYIQSLNLNIGHDYY